VNIVALHPGVGDSRIWERCAPVWAAAGFRTIAYDRRGFRETRWQPERYDDLADLLAVTSEMASRPAVIVGNSLGGGLALDLALAHPDHVLGLVLIAPAPSGYPTDDWPITEAEAAQDALVEDAARSGDLDLVNRLEVRYWLDGTEQPEGRVQGTARDLMVDMNGRALTAQPTGEALQREPAWPILDRIRIPTLIVAGEHDLPGVRQICERLGEGIAGAQVVTISDTAHCPSLDQPDALNELVLDFLGSLPPVG
jgi:pimeloyl-ACP methyl ester carboxylesterase